MQPLPDSEYPFGSFTRGASVGDEGERAIEHASTDVDLNSGLAIFLLDPYFGGDGLVLVVRHRDPDKTWTIRHPSSWRHGGRRRSSRRGSVVPC